MGGESPGFSGRWWGILNSGPLIILPYILCSLEICRDRYTVGYKIALHYIRKFQEFILQKSGDLLIVIY